MREETDSEKLARIEVLLSDAFGGAVTDEPNHTEWDAVRMAEHVRERQAAIVLLLEDIFGGEAEHLGSRTAIASMLSRRRSTPCSEPCALASAVRTRSCARSSSSATGAR